MNHTDSVCWYSIYPVFHISPAFYDARNNQCNCLYLHLLYLLGANTMSIFFRCCSKCVKSNFTRLQVFSASRWQHFHSCFWLSSCYQRQIMSLCSRWELQPNHRAMRSQPGKLTLWNSFLLFSPFLFLFLLTIHHVFPHLKFFCILQMLTALTFIRLSWVTEQRSK